MSLLFPLYVLGGLALVAPILFHFYQRKPHGQQEFSSLMFLRPTPPRLTRRSRISDLLLLLLRGLVLLLLAMAFARPFLRSSSLLDLNAPSRSVALLVDTSASMRRDGVWTEMQASIDKTIQDLRATDQVTLVSFDREPETRISFEAWANTEPSRRLALLKQQVKSLRPTWYATDLAAAAIAAGDALLQQRLLEDGAQPLQAVVFTDLQEGSDLSGLQTYQWPEDITVDVKTISPSAPTNASLQSLPPEASELDSSQVRVLVRNEANSNQGQFQLSWKKSDARPIEVYVPPGQTRVVRVTQPPGARELLLTGDDHEFDNQLFLTETKRRQKRLWYIGDQEPNDNQQLSLFFYLSQSALDTRVREVTIERLDDVTRLATVEPKQCPLIVISKPVQEGASSDLRRYVARGGRALIVLRPAPDYAEMSAFLNRLLGLDDVKVEARKPDDYSMLARIDFQNPLFRTFADPRFNDFTKIHFWSHRELTSGHPQPWTSLADFDNGFPALVEKQIEQGTVWVMTSSWQPDDSQLALSSKFIPLLHGFFGRGDEPLTRASSYEVGEAIKLAPSDDVVTIVGPGGQMFSLEAMSGSFNEAVEPGIYEIRQGNRQYDLAVNVAALESRTNPLLRDRLEQLGLTLGKQKSVDLLANEQRQMRNKELEGNQKLWRWGILAALVFVALETWVGARSARPILSQA